MGLLISKGISQDGKTFYVTDVTTDYGVGIPARNTFALIPYVLHKASAGDFAVPVNNYDPLDVVTFSMDVTDRDGVYDIHVFALPRYVDEVLVDGNIVYDTNDGLIKKRIAGVLTEVTIASLIAEASVEKTFTDGLITTQVTIYKDQLELVFLDRLEDYDGHLCDYNDLQTAKRNFDHVRALRSGAIINKCSNQKINAQLKIESAIDLAKKALEI